MSLLGTIVGTATRLLTRPRDTTDDDGQIVEGRQVRPFPASLGALLAGMLLWHFFLHPVLTYIWPDVGFPALDLSILTAIVGIGL